MRWLAILLALVPIVLAWLQKEFLSPRPFWSFYYDPELIYFHGGRSFVLGHLPENLDNPGVPLDVVSALVVAIAGSNPEAISHFLLLAHIAVFVISAASLAFAARTIFGNSDWKIQVAGVWIFYCCAQSLEYINVLSPEAMFAALGGLFTIALWRCAVNGLSRRSILLAALMLGLACSLKFTFLPLAVSLLLALLVTSPSVSIAARELGLAMLGLSGGLLLGILPAIGGYDRIFSLLARMATHGGKYGVGAPEVPAISDVVARVIDAIMSAKSWYVLIASLCALIALGAYREHRSGRALPRGIRFVVVFALLGIALTHAVLLRPAGLRYLLPAAFCGILLLAAAAQLRPLKGDRRVQWLLFGTVALLLGRHISSDATTHRNRIRDELATQESIAKALHAVVTVPQPIVVYGFGAPMPSIALRMETGDENFQRQVDLLYPREGHVLSEGMIRLPAGLDHWDAAVVQVQDVAPNPRFRTARIAARAGVFAVLVPKTGAP
jgi:hypothetical protein